MSATIPCKKCGSEVRRGMMRCRECGEPVGSPKADGDDSNDAGVDSGEILAQAASVVDDSRPTSAELSCPTCGTEMRKGVIRCRECGYSRASAQRTAAREPLPCEEPLERETATALAPEALLPSAFDELLQNAGDLDAITASSHTRSMAGEAERVEVGKRERPSTGRAEGATRSTPGDTSIPATAAPPSANRKPLADRPSSASRPRSDQPLTERPSKGSGSAPQADALVESPTRSGRSGTTKTGAVTPAKSGGPTLEGRSTIRPAASKPMATEPSRDPKAAEPVAKTPAEPPVTPLSFFQMRTLKGTLATKGLDKPRLAEDRRAAIRGAVASRDPRLVPLFRDALRDDWIIVREAAAEALGQMKATEAVDSLIEVLESDSSVDVRRLAGLALVAIGDPQAVAPLLALGLSQPTQRLWTLEATARLGRPAIPALSKALSHADPGMRLDAATVLGKIKDSAAVKPLVAALRDNVGLVRAHATEALGHIADPRVIPHFIHLLSDEEPGVVASAAFGLSRVCDETALVPLLTTLKDADPTVRAFAATALGKIGDARALKGLLPRLADKEEVSDVKLQVARALGRIGHASAFAALRECLSEPAIPVLKAVVEALGHIGHPETMSTLLEVLHNPHDVIRQQAIESLGLLGEGAAAKAVMELLHRERSTEVRLAAVRTLGQLRDAAAIPTLKEALRDQFTVRCRAVVALGEIGTPEVVEILLPLLRDPVAEIQYHAAIALGNIGDRRALRGLEELMSSDDPIVLHGVGKALEILGDRRAKQVLERGRQLGATKSQTAKGTGSEAGSTSSSPKTAADSRKQTRPAQSGPSLLTQLASLPTRLIPNSLVGLLSRGGSSAGAGSTSGTGSILNGFALSPQTLGALGSIAGMLLVGFLVYNTFFKNAGAMRSIARGKPRALTFTNGNTVVVSTSAESLEFWDVGSGRTTGSVTVTGLVASRLAAQPDGAEFAAASQTGEVHIFSSSGSPLRKIAANGVLGLEYSADGQTLYAIGNNGTFSAWDAKTGNSKGTFTQRGIATGAFSADGKWIALGRPNGEVWWLEFPSGKEVGKIPAFPARPIAGVAFSSDSKLLVAASDQGRVRSFDLIARQPKATLDSQVSGTVTSVRLVPGGTTALIATSGGDVYRWDSASTKASSLPSSVELDGVSSLSLSGDGKRVVACSSNNYDINVWLEAGAGAWEPAALVR